MYILYDILLHLSLLLLIPYFLFKMFFVGKYRKGILERFGFIDKEKIRRLSVRDAGNSGKVVWFHAVSVGETKAVLPLLKRFKERRPDVKVIFSTVTNTGNTVAMREGAQWMDSLIYFPLDFYWVVSRVVERLGPDAFVVVEKEIWPNILRVFKKNKTPVLVINGVISDRSFKRYSFFEFFFRRIFGNISYFLSQTEQDRSRAVALGVEPARCLVAGNIKFDITPAEWPAEERGAFISGLNIKDSDKIIVAGSTHAGEEEIILDTFKRLKQEFSDIRLILAPRHPERFSEVERLIKDKGFSMIRRSEIRSQESEVRSQKIRTESLTPNSKLPTPNLFEVILLDTIGELCNIYSLATAAFVGGTLVDTGGHNLMEPAFYRKPVVYGPYLRGYLEMAEMLEKAGGGIRVNNGEGLFIKLRDLLNDKISRKNTGLAAYGIVESNRGATEKCLKVLESLLLE